MKNLLWGTELLYFIFHFSGSPSLGSLVGSRVPQQVSSWTPGKSPSWWRRWSKAPSPKIGSGPIMGFSKGWRHNKMPTFSIFNLYQLIPATCQKAVTPLSLSHTHPHTHSHWPVIYSHWLVIYSHWPVVYSRFFFWQFFCFIFFYSRKILGAFLYFDKWNHYFFLYLIYFFENYLLIFFSNLIFWILILLPSRW